MSLDPTSLAPGRLAGGIKAALVAMGASPTDPKTTQFALDFAAAIVKEFKENAELTIDLGPPPTGTIT